MIEPTQIFATMNIFSKLIAIVKKYLNNDLKIKENIATRFLKVCESHGINANQIPKLIGGGVTIADVQSHEKILLKLNDEILDELCSSLNIRRAWLDGEDQQVYPTYNFYKNPTEFALFLQSLKQNNLSSHFTGTLIISRPLNYDSSALLLITEHRDLGWSTNKRIERYYLINGWVWTYWKCRAYLTSCIALAERENIYFHAYLMSKEIFTKFESGEYFFNQSDLKRIVGWYPSDLYLSPEVFLKDVDRELNNFGYRAGLSLWLELEEKGLVMTHNYAREVREKFAKALDEI